MREARDQGTVKNGVPVLDNRDRFRSDLKELEGLRVTFHVFAGVTKKQFGYYWVEVIPKIAEEIGQDVDFTHALMKRKFNPITVESVNKKTGEVETYVIGGSFKDLGKAAMSPILDKVIWWGRDFIGADIHEPTPQQRANPFGSKE